MKAVIYAVAVISVVLSVTFVMYVNSETRWKESTIVEMVNPHFSLSFVDYDEDAKVIKVSANVYDALNILEIPYNVEKLVDGVWREVPMETDYEVLGILTEMPLSEDLIFDVEIAKETKELKRGTYRIVIISHTGTKRYNDFVEFVIE